MRTSLNEIKYIEQHLLGKSTVEDQLVFQAQLQINQDLKQKSEAQKLLYELIKLSGRNALIAEIQQVQRKLFNEKKFQSFQNQVASIFNKPRP